MPGLTVEQTKWLQKTPLLAELSDTELSFLGQRAVPRSYGPGQLIFSEGDPCEGLFVVESGEMRIFKTSASGREQVLAIEGPGASVAELPVFDGGAYPASASAVTRTSVLLIRKQDFQALCIQHPQVSLKVLTVVGTRLRRLVSIIEELSFTTVRHRLASQLLRLANAKGAQSGQGIEFTLPNNQELAAQIGTVRELVSRNLSRLQAVGIIRLHGKQVIVPDLRALQDEVESDDE